MNQEARYFSVVSSSNTYSPVYPSHTSRPVYPSLPPLNNYLRIHEPGQFSRQPSAPENQYEIKPSKGPFSLSALMAVAQAQVQQQSYRLDNTTSHSHPSQPYSVPSLSVNIPHSNTAALSQYSRVESRPFDASFESRSQPSFPPSQTASHEHIISINDLPLVNNSRSIAVSSSRPAVNLPISNPMNTRPDQRLDPHTSQRDNFINTDHLQVPITIASEETAPGVITEYVLRRNKRGRPRGQTVRKLIVEEDGRGAVQERVEGFRVDPERSTNTDIMREKRKEKARMHYERNKEKRRAQMKEYQRKRRLDPVVRERHNFNERDRLRRKRANPEFVELEKERREEKKILSLSRSRTCSDSDEPSHAPVQTPSVDSEMVEQGPPDLKPHRSSEYTGPQQPSNVSYNQWLHLPKSKGTSAAA